MRYGRFNSDGLLMEINDITVGSPATKYHPDLAVQFEEIPADKEPGDHRVGGVWLGKLPPGQIISNGVFIDNPLIAVEAAKTAILDTARQNITSNANSANSVAALREVVKDLYRLVTGEDPF